MANVAAPDERATPTGSQRGGGVTGGRRRAPLASTLGYCAAPLRGASEREGDAHPPPTGGGTVAIVALAPGTYRWRNWGEAGAVFGTWGLRAAPAARIGNVFEIAPVYRAGAAVAERSVKRSCAGSGTTTAHEGRNRSLRRSAFIRGLSFLRGQLEAAAATAVSLLRRQMPQTVSGMMAP